MQIQKFRKSAPFITSLEKTCAGHPLPASPIFGPRASTTLVARAQGGPWRGKTRQDRQRGRPEEISRVRSRAREQRGPVGARLGWAKRFEKFPNSHQQLCGVRQSSPWYRCGDIHRCRSPEKTCPEGLTRAWEDLLYPKKTGKVCHGRSLGAPWTSADVLQRFRSLWRFWSLWRFQSLSGDPAADLVAPLVGSMMEKKRDNSRFWVCLYVDPSA